MCWDAATRLRITIPCKRASHWVSVCFYRDTNCVSGWCCWSWRYLCSCCRLPVQIPTYLPRTATLRLPARGGGMRTSRAASASWLDRRRACPPLMPTTTRTVSTGQQFIVQCSGRWQWQRRPSQWYTRSSLGVTVADAFSRTPQKYFLRCSCFNA